MTERCILHCDMNNFYASVECMLHPPLRGHPVAVCGETEERHGIVLAKNYEAKAYGVTTGEAVWQAKKKCPGLIVVPPHFEEYLRISARAREIYGRYTDLVEPMGLDECWLDVTGSGRFFGTGIDVAEKIRQSIKRELGVTVSIGVSFNKVFAKLGSDMKKPDAITVIPSDGFRAMIWGLPVSDLFGVGRATAVKLMRLGVLTIGDLACYPPEQLQAKFGKCGQMLWRFANGLDTSRVVTRGIHDLDKTTGHGITTLADLENEEEVWPVMLELAQDVGHRLFLYGRRASGVCVSVRDNALMSRQWQGPLPYPTGSAFVIATEAFALFRKSYLWTRPIRSLSIRVISLLPANVSYQLDFFTDARAIERREVIDRTVEDIRARYGAGSIRNAVLLHNPKMPGSDVLRRSVLNKSGMQDGDGCARSD